MTEEATQDLVRRLETEAAASPETYRREVKQLAALGFGYIILILLLAAVLLVVLVLAVARGNAGVLSLKLSIPLLFLIAVILRAFWVRIPLPTSRVISRQECPELWHMVDELCHALATPPVHEIQVDENFNASIAQIPQLGILGWHRNYLTLGLPLLKGLTLDQVRAIVGHELGHLSGNHSKFAASIYRLRQTWTRLLTALEEQKSGLGDLLFTRFFKWYAPYFSAYSFVMARADEYEADQCAALSGGPAAARSALVRLEVVQRMLNDRHLPGLSRRLADEPDPPGDYMHQMEAALQAAVPSADLASYVKGALAVATGYADTHPSLADRLAGLGWRDAPPDEWSAEPAKGADAASLLLGDLDRELTDRMSKEWEERHREVWRLQHNKLQKVRAELTALEKAAEAGPLEPEAAWQRVGLTSQLDQERAFELGRAFLDAHPDHALPHFHVGIWLLERKDLTGLTHLDRAAELDSKLIIPASQIAASFLTGAGREEEAVPYRERMLERARLLEAAELERTTMNRDMVLEPSGLAETELIRLRTALASFRDVVEVYVTLRRTTILPEMTCYLVGVRPRRSMLGRPVIDEPALIQRLAAEVEWPVGVTYFVIVLKENKWLRRRMLEMGGLLIEQ